MAEKSDFGVARASQDENVTPPGSKLGVLDDAPRNQSVALNIVENPLKVSFPLPDFSSFFLCLHRVLTADNFHPHSVAPRSRSLSMPRLSPRRMDWQSTPLSLVGLPLLRATLSISRRSPSSIKSSAMRCRTKETTSGMALLCFGTRSRCAPLEPPRKDGIRPDPTEQTYPFPRSSTSMAQEQMNGSWESSMPSSF